MPDVVMPRLSDSMEEGTILKWLVESGTEVARGQEIAEIETDKATMSYEADTAGVIEIVAAEGDTLPIGALIARIGGEGATTASGNGASAKNADVVETPAASPVARPTPTPTPTPTDRAAQPSPSGGQPARSVEGGERVKASPLARRLAKERGLDLHGVHGTGPGGRIVRADVEGAQAAPAPSPTTSPADTPAAGPPETAKGTVTAQELTRAQQVVARRMAESKATIPEFTLTSDVDMTEAVALRAQIKGLGREPVPSFNDMVVRACALALREFPRANGSYRDGRFELYGRVNVGVAVAAEDSLVVPTVFDADARTLGDIAATTRALAERVRSGQITPPELSGGTFTVSNLGMYGVSSFTAVINPPQAAILAVGALAPRAVPQDDGSIAVRQVMPVTLACDHRILYGADAARFLARIRELLETPVALLV